MFTLGHALNQGVYPGAGDWDDCWVVAAIQAARAVGGRYTGPGATIQPEPTGTAKVSLPTIPTFRAKSGKPDVQGVSNGGTSADIIKGATGCFPDLQIAKASTTWSGFLHQTKDLGWVAAVAVLSSALPVSLQYGFKGLHEVSVAYKAGGFDIVNPLAPQGLMPQRISEANLRKAMEGFAKGVIAAVLFKGASAPAPAPVPVPAPKPVPAPAPQPEPADTTPFSQADMDAAVAKAIMDTKASARIVYGA